MAVHRNAKCLWLSACYYYSLHNRVIYVPGWLRVVVTNPSLSIIKAVTPLLLFICVHSARYLQDRVTHSSGDCVSWDTGMQCPAGVFSDFVLSYWMWASTHLDIHGTFWTTYNHTYNTLHWRMHTISCMCKTNEDMLVVCFVSASCMHCGFLWEHEEFKNGKGTIVSM